MRRPAHALCLLVLFSLTSCGWLDARRSRSPLGRGCSLGFEQAGRIENVMGVIQELNDDWVVLRESDGTTIWVSKDHVVWMRVEPPK